MEEDRLLRIEEAGKLLGISRSNTFVWIRRGWIRPTILPSGKKRVAMSEIQRIIREGEKV